MTAEPAREPLSGERVFQAAIAVADSDGLAAVTMRRVAADLGVEAMSLYHHVRGKEQLLDGLIEAVDRRGDRGRRRAIGRRRGLAYVAQGSAA